MTMVRRLQAAGQDSPPPHTMHTNDEIATAKPLAAIEVRQSGVHGHGVFALRALRARQKIGTYTGRRYAPDQEHESWDQQLTYLFGLSDGSMIDGAQGGNETRHINHSCEPNVEAIEDSDDAGHLVITIRALRRIRAGEELFLDYALDVGGEDPAEYPCRCGSTHCRGTLLALSTSDATAEQ
jgi:SET domain-containing protein